MATGLMSNTFSRLLPSIRQYEATTGRKISPQMLEALLKAEYEEASRTAYQGEQVALQKRQEERLDKQSKQEAAAARTSGFIQAGGTAAQLGLLGRYGYLGQTMQSALGGGTPAAAVSTTAAPIGAQATTSGMAVGGQAALPAINLPAATAATAATSETAAVTPGLFAGSTPASLAGPALASAGAGYATGKWAGQVYENKPANVRLGVGTGAVAGATIGAIGGPPGMVIGGIVGGIAGGVGASK